MLMTKQPFAPMFDPHSLRQQFPALQKQVNGNPVIFLDGPGGTQVPQMVIDAMMAYLIRDNSNSGGVFLNSLETNKTVSEARRAIADLFNARRPEEIVFGQNMTSLTFAMSRALAKTWQKGDEIVVSQIDHNANIDPWLMAAQDAGATVRWLPVDTERCTLKLSALPDLLSEKTRLVAVTFASNAVGSVTDVKTAVQMAHDAGALAFVDAVHFAPHGPIDVQALDCDFLASSPYKYYGPHIGALYGKYELLAELEAYKVRPATNQPAGKWEMGTQSFESMAGARAAVDYLASIGEKQIDTAQYEWPQLNGRRLHLRQAMTYIQEYEAMLSEQFISGAQAIRGLELYGVVDDVRRRTPTFAVRLTNQTPEVVARALARQGIFCWHGDFYARNLIETLGLAQKGGVVRLGFVHYNTPAEVSRTLAALELLAD